LEQSLCNKLLIFILKNSIAIKMTDIINEQDFDQLIICGVLGIASFLKKEKGWPQTIVNHVN